MSTDKSISNRVGEVLFTVSSFCEEGLTTAGKIINVNLTYCAYTWLNGKLFDGCGSLSDSANLFQPGRCQTDDQALQTAMIIKLACMSFLAVATATKCASSALLPVRGHQKLVT